LQVNPVDEVISIGGEGVADREKAALWFIKDQEKRQKSPRTN
jgi:hypothetical protein